MQQPIVTVTINPAVDKLSGVAHIVPDRKLRCRAPRFDAGGGGINVAKAVHYLGGTCQVLLACGGATGELLQVLLKRDGIAHHVVPISGITRENLTVTEEATGQQYRFQMPGPLVVQSEWQLLLDTIPAVCQQPAYIVASGSLPPGVPAGFYSRVARLGKSMNARVVVDTSGEALSLVAQEGAYAIKPNRKEFAALVGRELEDDGKLEEAARDFVKNMPVEVLIVSLGASGVLLATANGLQRLRAPSVKVVSVIGAGDSMLGAVVLALARGEPMTSAMLYGLAAGSAAVMSADTGLCSRDNVEKLYQVLMRTTPD